MGVYVALTGHALLQLVRNVAVVVLGQFRFGRFDRVRLDRNQKFHPILGPTRIRMLFGHKYNRLTQHAHRHDVQFVPDNIGERYILVYIDITSVIYNIICNYTAMYNYITYNASILVR